MLFCVRSLRVRGRMLFGSATLCGFRLFRSLSTSVVIMIMFGIVWKGVSPKSGSGSEVCLEKTDWNCLFRRLALARGFSIVSPWSVSGTTPVVSTDCFYHYPVLFPMSIIGSTISSKYFWYCCLIFLCAWFFYTATVFVSG